MGTWAAPDTHDKIAALEELMEHPVMPEDYWTRIQSLIGDDGLADMASIAGKADPQADIRPAIAAILEYWTRWMPISRWNSPWEPGVRERALFLAERFFDRSLTDLLPERGLPDDPVAAACHVAFVTDADVSVGEYKVETIMPGLYAVKDTQRNQIYRVECPFETVAPCPHEVLPDIDLAFFSAAPGPTLN